MSALPGKSGRHGCQQLRGKMYQGWRSALPTTIDWHAATGSKPEKDTRYGSRAVLLTTLPTYRATVRVLTYHYRSAVIILRRLGASLRGRRAEKYLPRAAKTPGRSWAGK